MSDLYDGEWVVSAIIDDRAERFGDRLLVTSTDRDLTYGRIQKYQLRTEGMTADSYDREALGIVVPCS